MAAASKLGQTCDDLGRSATAGISPAAAMDRRSNADPNKVKFKAQDILGGRGVGVGGQFAFLPETTIAKVDGSSPRQLRTGLLPVSWTPR